MKRITRVSMAAAVALTLTTSMGVSAGAANICTVAQGDSLWKISQACGLSVDQLMDLNDLTSDLIMSGQELNLSAEGDYTIQKGDTLWLIAQACHTTVDDLMSYNNLTGDMIYPGQVICIPGGTSTSDGDTTTETDTSTDTETDTADEAQSATHTVVKGDTLWLISQEYGTTVDALMSANNLTSDMIYPGQVFVIPDATEASDDTTDTTDTSDSADTTDSTDATDTTTPTPVTDWPSITYTVQEGDTLDGIAASHGTTVALIMEYNYMEEGEWLDAGETIAINGYAPRNYDVIPGESAEPSDTGKLVDWFFDGQYLLKRDDTFLITDVATGKQFNVTMLGGINHADVEPTTAADTAVMESIFSDWTWTPRPVVIYHDGINFAASLSGMPHSSENITDNNVTGHFDLYLSGSTSHGSDVSDAYIQQHHDAVLVAAGQ